MYYREFRPAQELVPYVKCFWVLEYPADSCEVQRERILPDGCIEVIFHYGDQFRRHTDSGAYNVQPRCFVFGQIRTFIEIEPTGNSGMFAVRFTPFGAMPFFAMSIAKLTDQYIPLLDVWGKDGVELEDRILNASNNPSRISILQNFLLKRLAYNSVVDGRIHECVRRIVQSGGRLGVAHLLDGMDVGRRQLERQFTLAVGVNPKHLARIVRFQKVLELLQNNRFSTLTSLAHECGYYDQAHFIRDFKELAGITPSRYLKESHALSDVFIDAEEV